MLKGANKTIVKKGAAKRKATTPRKLMECVKVEKPISKDKWQSPQCLPTSDGQPQMVVELCSKQEIE